MQPFLRAAIIAAALTCGAASTFALNISGKVFHDRNNNGVQDAGEPGLSHVAVSDGTEVVLTAKSGYYTISTELDRLLFVSLPKGYRSAQSFYTRVGVKNEIHFPLVEWAESRNRNLRFVQVSDTHVSGREETVTTFVEDIEEINQLQPAAAFALATGDLVNVGTNTNEYESYVRGIAAFKIPFFSLPGNHDAKAKQGLVHYHRYLGPDYYSFNAGDTHFLLLNSMRFDEPVQQAWIQKDLAAAPKGSTLICAFHYLPTEEQIRFLSELGASAVLSGHWHGNRVRESLGVLDLNTPPLRFGGLDRHPRSFRILEINRGKVDNKLRLGGFKQHAIIVSPNGTVTSSEGKVPVVVNAYDSRLEIAQVECAFNGSRIRLKKASEWSWTGEIKLPKELRGEQSISAEIRAVNGEAWTQHATFSVGSHGPLHLKWAASTGGFMGFSSPQMGDKHVLVGIDDRGDLKQCGMVAFDLQGRRQWHFHTDSGIKNNIAAAKGRVYATSVAGWLYALDESSGKLLWKAKLGDTRERWEVAATTVHDGIIYAGAHHYIAAFDEAGKRLWATSNGTSDWVPSSYTTPTVADDRLLLFSRHGAFAHDTSTGKVIWKLDGRINGCLPVGDVVYTLRNNVLAAVSLASGKTVWSSKEKAGDTCSVPAISGDRIVVGTEDGRVCALSSRDGAKLWSFQTGPSLSSLQPYRRGASDVNSSPRIVGEKVYAAASDGSLYVLSLQSGEKLAHHAFGVPIAASPLVVGETVYLSTYDGNLYAFGVDHGTTTR